MQVLPLGEKNSEQPLGQIMGPVQLLLGEKKEKKRKKEWNKIKIITKKNSGPYVPLQRPRAAHPLRSNQFTEKCPMSLEIDSLLNCEEGGPPFSWAIPEL